MRKRRRIWKIALILAVIGLIGFLALSPPPPPEGIATEDVVAPDPDDKPIDVRIWYPEDRRAAGPVPLILISHGTGGSLTGHSDTAMALAQAGFVVAALQHTGDNFRGESYVGQGKHLIGRPRHVSRVIDYMLDEWPQRAMIDPGRIGMFGHSAGGFTTLVVAGGEPDLAGGAQRCLERPDAWDCQYLKGHGAKPGKSAAVPAEGWHHDPRVKVAVIAAPAVGYAFEPNGLSKVRIPIQLWAAEQDGIVEDSPAIIRKLLPSPPEYRQVLQAGHMSFLAPCNAVMRGIIAVMTLRGTLDICAEPGDLNRQEFHGRFNRSVIDFFQKNLN